MSTERSISRGREAVTYTYGRGGAGNKVRSPSRDAAGQVGAAPDDYSATRGRELPPSNVEGKVITYGRGGAANHRSLSRDAVVESRNALKDEAKYVREHATNDVPVSHGRGGAGNISNSRSRSRSRDPTALPGNPATVGVLHGKGGFGNVTDGTDSTLGRLAEEDEHRRVGAERHEREEKDGQVHSTGRGGFANFFHRTSTDGNSTRDKSRDASKPRKSGEFISTGRGGAANIVHRD